MQYRFDAGVFGTCRVELNTAGRHGFAEPKIFRIICLDVVSRPVYEFRFKNTTVAGVNSRELTNACLCRIAIAQFLVASISGETASTQLLDTTVPPFEGSVMNSRDVVLTFIRLHSPRKGYRRASSC